MLEFVLQFAFISLVASILYHTLRTDDVKGAVVLGVRRFASFFVIAIVFGVGLQLFTRWL